VVTDMREIALSARGSSTRELGDNICFHRELVTERLSRPPSPAPTLVLEETYDFARAHRRHATSRARSSPTTTPAEHS
jgi:hypothetical protein